MKIEYASVDNFYYCYANDNKFKYKHIFMPNPKYGKNSSNKIKAINKIKLPKRYNELKDQTKNIILIRKDTI